MYTVSLSLPSTKEGKEKLANRYSEILAKIAVDMLNTEELKILVGRLENKQ